MLKHKYMRLVALAAFAIGACATSKASPTVPPTNLSGANVVATTDRPQGHDKASVISNSEEPAASQLFNEIERMDGVLFDAFNTQNLDKLKTLFTHDLEFYQDNEGLDLYQQTMNDFQSMFEQNNKIRRELVKGSLEVYPIKDYGAIEIGVHKFCHVESGKDECGTFKFLHVWQNRDGEWKISRVVSYNH